jgi:hypothetical protein
MAEPLRIEHVDPRAGAAAVAILRGIDGALAARVRTGRDLAAAARDAPLARAAWSRPWSRALPDLARALPEGLPRGELTEIVGRRASGRMGLALALLAAATARGENAVLVDLGDALDVEGAAAAGIVLDRLLWARPTRLQHALAAAEAALAGGFPLVLLDLGLPPVSGGRGAEAQWLRLARAAREPASTLVVSSPYRATGIAAAAVLELGGARVRWQGRGVEPRLLDGVEPRLETARGRALVLSERVTERALERAQRQAIERLSRRAG